MSVKMKFWYLVESNMPKSCDKCPLKDLYSDFPNIYCNATNELINDGEDLEEGRHSTCPLRILDKE